MMTDEERLEYMNRMQSATSAQEREQIREEHHNRMLERARERGINLPDEPDMGPGMGGGKGIGSGMGGGMGNGMGNGMGHDNDRGNKK